MVLSDLSSSMSCRRNSNSGLVRGMPDSNAGSIKRLVFLQYSCALLISSLLIFSRFFLISAMFICLFVWSCNDLLSVDHALEYVPGSISPMPPSFYGRVSDILEVSLMKTSSSRYSQMFLSI